MIYAKIWQIYDDVGYAACQSGNLDLAQKMFELAVECCGGQRNMRSQRTKSMIGLADTAMLRGNVAESARLYTRVINAYARSGVATKQDQYMLAHALERLGYMRAEECRYIDAIKLLQRSVRLSERIYGSVHSELVTRLLKISLLLSQTGAVDQSLAVLHRARAIQETAQGVPS